MKISQRMMNKAVEAKIITEEQSHRLIKFLKNLPDQGLEFNLTNTLYYFGGLIAIGAMTIFVSLGWELYGGGWILMLSIFYALLGIALVHKFNNEGYIIPAGVCATFVIFLVPLAIYGFQKLMGWWPSDSAYQDYYRYTKWNWIYMELSTIAVGVIMAWFYRYPFMIMPISITLWCLSMDVTILINNGEYNYKLGAQISLYFGLAMILLAFWVDIRSRYLGDYAYWLYLVGGIAFWTGLTLQPWDSELSKFLYMCINVIMILVGVILKRKVFVLFGTFGFCFYLGYLAYKVFEYSYLFPVALTFFGMGIIYLGILWQKNEATITTKMRSFLPSALRDLLESREG